MILALYRALVWMQPAALRKQFGAEMEETFLAAAGKAREKGGGVLARFYLREFAGLFLGVSPIDRFPIAWPGFLATGAFAGIVFGIAAAGWITPVYTSTAVIRVPPQVPERIANNFTLPIADRVIQSNGSLLSRERLWASIVDYDLYLDQWGKQPKEALVEKLRDNTRIQREGDRVRIEFSYRDRHKAQKVTSDLTMRLIHDIQREHAQGSSMTSMLLSEEVALARHKLLAAMEKLKKTPPADSVQRSVIAIDAQIAQRTYESLNEKLWQSEISNLESRKQGEMPEVVDPPSLPESADWRRAVAPVAAVLMVLCLLGGVISSLQSARQAKLARWIPSTLVAEALRGPAVFEAVQEGVQQPSWMTTSQFYRALGRLIEKGVVERAASPVRRRLRVYRLTESGREFVEEEYDGPELPTPVVPMPVGRAG